MSQEQVFLGGEADRWFDRNRSDLAGGKQFDWPLHVLSQFQGFAGVKSVLELGCSNGWRLGRLAAQPGKQKRYVGVDPSEEALAAGRQAYPQVEFHHGVLAEVPLKESFDLVIVNFVLHWVDRASLVRSLAEVDRMVKDGGYLLIGDFLPDHPQKRPYHHLPGQSVFTFKQDYPATFAALGTYSEVARVTHEHAGTVAVYGHVPSGDRAVCSLLRKSLGDYYPEDKG